GPVSRPATAVSTMVRLLRDPTRPRGRRCRRQMRGLPSVAGAYVYRGAISSALRRNAGESRSSMPRRCGCVSPEPRYVARMVRKDGRAEDVRWADDAATSAETLFKLVLKSPEELDVLHLLTGEVDQGPRLVLIAIHVCPRVVEHERKDELLDHPEHREVLV